MRLWKSKQSGFTFSNTNLKERTARSRETLNAVDNHDVIIGLFGGDL